jgi:hypothetical protein
MSKIQVLPDIVHDIAIKLVYCKTNILLRLNYRIKELIMFKIIYKVTIYYYLLPL